MSTSSTPARRAVISARRTLAWLTVARIYRELERAYRELERAYTEDEQAEP